MGGEGCSSWYDLALGWGRTLPSERDGNLVLVPTATVTRLASEAPPLGSRYAFSDGGRTFLGVVTNVVQLDEKHATVTLELMPDEHRHLIDEG